MCQIPTREGRISRGDRNVVYSKVDGTQPWRMLDITFCCKIDKNFYIQSERPWMQL